MYDNLRNGDLVMMAGDRTSPNSPNKYETVSFLGVDCRFPIGTFKFARSESHPIFAICVMNQGGEQYAFEEYNQKLIKGFTYTACESENGSLGEWTYDPKMRSYTLNIPNSMLENKHYFLVRNKNIITDYGDSDYRIYKYNGKKDKIDETTEMIITAGMIDSGIIQKKRASQRKKKHIARYHSKIKEQTTLKRNFFYLVPKDLKSLRKAQSFIVSLPW